MYSTLDEQQLVALAKDLLASIDMISDNNSLLNLRKVVNYADWKYYVQDNPVFADVEYDRLFKKIKELEKNNPNWITKDSPTQRIAYGISEQFKTEPHLVPMLSLENSYNADDLLEWDKRCKDGLQLSNVEYTIEPKYDGAGISLQYEDDYLIKGLTRGDGIKGENITPNTKQIKSIPLQASFSKNNIQSIEIRGEVIIHKKAFKQFNEQRIADNVPPLANPRNAASGSLRMLDAREVAKRGLSAVLYHVSHYTLNDENSIPSELETHYDILRMLYNKGFNTPINEMKKCNSIEEVIAYCKEFEQKRDELPFEIDGMVIKVNNIHHQELLGMTTHHPRWAIAYKFKARQATSKLLNVVFQVGRTGNITPVAKMEPVAIGGVMVSSVSLFNEDIIKEKDLKIGDTVLVERAGDVIPYIVKSFSDIRTGNEKEIIFPNHCPECNEALFKTEGEAAWRCINLSCPAQVVERMIHFVSKDAMDIRNLGEANIRRFYQLGLLKNITDIYHLDFNTIASLDKFGEKSITNLKDSIEASKQQPLHRLIFALGIRFVGETTAKTLANAITNIKELCTWGEEQLCTLEDVGVKVANSVFQFFHNHENLHTISVLERIGVNLSNIRSNEPNGDSGIFNGQTVLFTGTLSHFKRSEAEALVEQNGGKILGSVSSKLNYLIVGADAGSKLEKAKKLGSVTILTEQEFLEMVKE